MLEQLNSAPMFLVAGAVILFVIVFCLIFLVKSWRAGIALGIDPVKLRRAVTSSATFSLLPAVSVLLGVIALSGSLGIPLPWLRLSVIGALHYEGNAADVAVRAAGMTEGLGTGELTGSMFVTIGLVMTAGILCGSLLCIFFLKKYLAKVSRPREQAQEGAPKKKGFGDVAFTAMFVGLVSTYIGSYLGTWTSTGDFLPLAVAFVAGAAMMVFDFLSRNRSLAWLESFSVAGSMFVGMAVAVWLGTL